MAKKIGILFGMEDTFPWAFIDRVNELGKGKVIAEKVEIDKVEQGVPSGYDVILDRISQDVPFYRAYLKNAALTGTTVINNPFWWSADEKFFNNCLLTQLGLPVPETFLLPSHDMPDDTSENSFRNLKYPLDWDYIFEKIGFPAYMKPYAGGGWKNVYRVESPEDMFEKLSETGQLVMMLQKEIVFEDYYRVYCLGRERVHIMPYEPRNPHHLRYATEPKTTGAAHKKLMDTITDYTLKINRALGYDFNTVEFAIKDGIPYAIDFGNPAPDADKNSVGEENFDWIVQNAAEFAIEKALENKGNMHIDWGDFVTDTLDRDKKNAKANASKTTAKKKAAPKKKSTTAKASSKKVKAAKATPKKKASPKAAAKKTTKASPKTKGGGKK